MAPFTPYLADKVYRGLTLKEKSVHLTDYPVPEPSVLEDDLINQMESVRRAAALTLSARAREGIKVRQPLSDLYVKGLDEGVSPELKDMLLDEVNMKKLVMLGENDAFPKSVTFLEEGKISVGVSFEINDDLLAEGIARDVVRAIQDLRKKSGLLITDQVDLYIQAASETRSLLEKHEKDIRTETLAKNLSWELDPKAIIKELKVGDEDLVIGLKRVKV